MWGLLLATAVAVVGAVDPGTPVDHPELKFDDIGGRLGLFGDYDSLSKYTFVGETGDQQSDNGDKLFSFDDQERKLIPVGLFNGIVSQMEPLNDHQVVVNGNITKVGDQDVQLPFIFDVSDRSVLPIASQSSGKRDNNQLNGDIHTMLVDGNLIYLGGQFEFNGSHGAAVYDTESKLLLLLPFRGFGENGIVNAITRIPNNDGLLGLIVFGGNFNTLGFPELLARNITTNTTTNTTNSLLVTVEQSVPIANGKITLNGQGDPNALVCPLDDETWHTYPGQGAEWSVELPGGIQGTMPTKIRLTMPQGENQVNLFRIYTFPSNGIMNLSYVDPYDNTVKYCDAWCPLSALAQLQNSTNNNKDTNNTNDRAYISNDGSYNLYQDDMQVQTLGYGSNWQEFLFVNNIGVSRLTVTVLGWTGEYGALSGIQLYLNTILAYANNELNTPNCAGAAGTNQLLLSTEGQWTDVLQLAPNPNALSSQNYLVSELSDAKISMTPNIQYLGDYQLNFYTPGCVADGLCQRRGIVNVNLVDEELNQVLASHQVWQNNDYDKFDYLYNGHLDGAVQGGKGYRIDVSYQGQIIPDTQPYIVADKALAIIVKLDNTTNITNSTRTNTTTKLKMEYVRLNGLFEYLLKNFSLFDVNQVNKTNSTIYVGNSLINQFSASLGEPANITELVFGPEGTIVVLGRMENVTDIVLLKVTGYNSTGAGITNLGSNLLAKRDIQGVKFLQSPTKAFVYDKYWIFCGNFTTNNNLKNVAVFDTSAHNWYTINQDGQRPWTQFTNTTIDGTLYWVFSDNDGYYLMKVSDWELTHGKRDTAPSYDLKIRQASHLSDTQQVLGGSLFGVMDYYGIDQAYIDASSNFTSYPGLTVTLGVVTRSFYINDLVSVIGGHFSTDQGLDNVAFVSNSLVDGLQGVKEWGTDTHVQTLYVTDDEELLFMGINGTLTVSDKKFNPGLVIYGLKNHLFTLFQPSELTNDNYFILVNSIVLYKNKVLVGGNFTLAGLLDCNGLCVYDTSATRWVSPRANGLEVEGIVHDIRFFSANKVFIAGALKLDGRDVNFVTYDLDALTFLLPDDDGKLNLLGTDKTVRKFIVNDAKNTDLDGRMVAFGDDFVLGYDGKSWKLIDSEFGSDPQFLDLKLIDLKEANKNYNGELFDSSYVLGLSGRFSLKDYGTVLLALYNGSLWIPYVYGLKNGTAGLILSLLLDDRFSYLSPKLMPQVGKLLVGKVVGISLACAIGLTALLGLLWLIPYILLFRKQLDGNYYPERVDEKEMMEAVNPDDLLHEIDLQRNGS